ncbi:MAG: hypothetical protein JWP12_279 [Bacteroidetes bacterium]|nr:hypothetical protein [Bacteroidota bacterium]
MARNTLWCGSDFYSKQDRQCLPKTNSFCFYSPAVLFFSCDKDEYEDGGKHAKASENLINYWTLKQFTVNGADSLGGVDPRYKATEALRIIATHHSGISFSAPNPLFKAGYPLVLFETSLSLVDHDNKLKFNKYGSLAFSNYPFIMADAEWEILKLQKSEMKLRMHNYQNDKVDVMVLEAGY